MITGTRAQGTPNAAAPPMNVEIAMPATARLTSRTRVRVTPWNETIPAGTAPSAAKVPYST